MSSARRLDGKALADVIRSEVAVEVAEGRSNKEVADVLGISLKTVEAHRSKVMSKLGLHSVAELVRVAIREGVVEP